jgi:hypothetical protein
MRPRSILVGLILVLMLAYSVAVYVNVIPLRRSLDERGWNATPRVPDGAEAVERVDPAGPAAGVLQLGDEVIALNGEPVEYSDQKMESAYGRVARGGAYTLTVRRAGQTLDLTLRSVRAPLTAWLINPWRLAVLFLTFVYLAVGFSVFALKPDNAQALVLALALTTFGSPFEAASLSGDMDAWLAALHVAGSFVRGFALVFVLHLFLIFPEPVAALRRPWLIYSIYLPAVLMSLRGLASDVLTLLNGVDNRLLPHLQYPTIWNPRAPLILVLFFIYLVGALVVLTLQYRRAGELSRRKLRIILVGSLVGIGSLVVFVTLSVWFNLSEKHPTLHLAMMTTMDLLQCALPLSFAYAIVRHQVIPVNLIIRRGLQYLLAKNALRLAVALPVAGLVLSIISKRDRPLAEIMFGGSLYFYLFIAAVALALVFRKRLGEWVDRKFFRESYNQEKILRELTDDVKKLDSIPEMSRRVTERVTAALHPAETFLFYREEGTHDLSLTYTSGGTIAAKHELKIPEEFRLLRFMEDQGSAQEFPFPQKNSLPQSEKTWLAGLGTRLIVPLTGTDERLAGLLLLGEKKSEVPYTAGDRELLERLAGQIAIVYENVRLKNRVDRDRKIKHEVLARVAGQDMNVLKECPRCGACFDMTAQTCPADGTELTLPLPVERTIETRYRLERLLGKGGMGAVYEATDLRLHRKVAVKILTGSMFGNSEALRRFEREAQASARLHHPNIVTVHDYGLLSTEGAYLVMELVAGETLGARLKRERQLAPAVAADLFGQILDGLHAAHAAGVVHRDLKPENVLLSPSETGGARVHLLDFGLAKLTQTLPADSHSPTAAAPVTTPGAVMGTFGYMSPEQLTGGAVDERTDLFSIGVMVVEAVTGRRPFTGTTYHELLTNILNAPYRLEAAAPAAAPLDAALQKSLAKDRAARFASAAAMRQELIPALRQCPPLVSLEAAAAPDAETFILKN